MKYRATEPGFIDRFIKPGDVVEWDGPPPIAGLELIDEPPQADLIERPSKRQRAAKAEPSAADPGDEPDVI